jgi:hypothetical protein
MAISFLFYLSELSQSYRISNFFDLSITEKTLLVKMRICCIKIGIVLVLYLISYSKSKRKKNSNKPTEKHKKKLQKGVLKSPKSYFVSV